MRALRRRLLLLRRLPQGVFRIAADAGNGCGRGDALLLFLVVVALLVLLSVVLLLPIVVVGSYDVGQLGKIGEPCKEKGRTGLSVVPRLREFLRQVEAEVLSKSRNVWHEMTAAV